MIKICLKLAKLAWHPGHSLPVDAAYDQHKPFTGNKYWNF